MAIATPISLSDAQATPVAHVFNPIGLDDKRTFWFVDSSAANAIGNWKISVEISYPPAAKDGDNSSKRTNRVRVGLHEPVLETVSNNTVSGIAPAPTVAYIPRSFHEFVMPERAVSIDRKSLRKMSYNLLNDANIVGVIENLTFLS